MSTAPPKNLVKKESKTITKNIEVAVRMRPILHEF